MRLFIGGRYELGRRRAVYELTRLAAAYNAICEQREVCLYDGTFRRTRPPTTSDDCRP